MLTTIVSRGYLTCPLHLGCAAFSTARQDHYLLPICDLGFPGSSEAKNLPVNVGDTGLIPRSERPLEKDMANYSSILAWESPWREGPGGSQSMGMQKSQI